MKLAVLIVILASVAAVATLVVVALYLHKKAGTGDVRLIGELAQVDTKLDPEGSVIVAGELWRARSISGYPISTRARVRIVGFENHLALVEACD
ncbi:MAG: NfeD family protein [Pyrinomonadaceae bacterium]